MNLFYDVVIKLTGDVRATGCHTTDDDRFYNLDNLCNLAEDIVYELIQASKTRDDYRISMSNIGKRATTALDDIKIMIEGELDEN